MQKKWKIMIILLTILIILYALTSCKEKIQEKKGNEDNWKVYQQLEEKEEQNIQNPFIREETKCILTEKEKQELRNQLLKIVTQCLSLIHISFFCHTGNGIYNHAKFRIWWGFRCNRTSG